MKKKYARGLLAALLLLVCLLPFPAQAETAALKWIEVDKPGTSGNVVVSPSEVSEIAVGSSGVLYAADSQNSKIYRSLDGGVTWEDITDKLAGEGAGLPASKIAVAPDKPGIVAVVTDGASSVYVSTDGGINWVDTGVPDLGSNKIQTIAISKGYNQGSKSFREIAIGTADWGNDTTSGQVWVYQVGKSWAPWQNQGLSFDPDPLNPATGGEVSALAYSPGYPNDMTILVIASTSNDISGYENKTYLCLGVRDTLGGTTEWNNPPEAPAPPYPVEIAQEGDVPSAGDAIGVSWIHSSLALPSNYTSEEASSRRLFVSYDREPTDAGDDVYLLNDTDAARLDVDNGDAIDISSIAYHGTTTSGVLLAGDVGPTGSSTVQVRRTSYSYPFSTPLTWEEASVPPTGPGNAKLGWSPDGQIAYCGTGQLPGDDLDESALSASVDSGDKWRQLGLIDTEIIIADVAPSPDGESLFVTTYSLSGPEGVWRSTSDPSGRYWERVLTLDTDTDAVILRLSPDYSDDRTIYAAEVGGNLMAVSFSGGDSWSWRKALSGELVDMVVEDEDTAYIALADGIIKKSTQGGHVWKSQGDTSIAEINMLALAGEETILIGSKDGKVAYSTDGGASFTSIRKAIGTGNVQVVADAKFEENSIIYAATDIADEGIRRWTIGVSTDWEQIDESITELGGGQRIAGLAVGAEGALYALRLEPASGASGGIIRSLNPTAPDPTEVEFDLVNRALPAGVAFDPTPLFPTLPYLKLSGDAGQNQLWTIDTANQIIYRFRDTLCKLGPTPVAPRAGDIIIIDTAGHIDSLTLQWEEIAGAREYEAAIYTDAEATREIWSGTTTGMAINAAEGNNPAMLASGTSYYWRVRATQPIESPWSEVRSFASPLGIAEWSPLSTTSGVSPLPGANDMPIRPAFSWESADGATGYEFVLARDSGFTEVVVALTDTDVLTSAAWNCDRDLDYATSYFWKVRAVSGDSYSEWGVNTFTTETAPSAPPPQTSSPLIVEPAPTVPAYVIWLAIGVGSILIVALLVFILRTRS
jgi:photosystem II stability/assembly factor-like uncharacterized protein